MYVTAVETKGRTMRIIHTNDDAGWCVLSVLHRPGDGETLGRDGVVTVVTCTTCGTYLYTKVEEESK